MLQLRIDMRLTDDAVLDILAQRKERRISSYEIASRLQCHVNTVQIALNRLEAAGKIKRRREARGQAYTYEVICQVTTK
jgi:predicted transcriptional regulator